MRKLPRDLANVSNPNSSSTIEGSGELDITELPVENSALTPLHDEVYEAQPYAPSAKNSYRPIAFRNEG